MDVDVTLLASLQLVLRHKEPAVQTLVKFIENQTTLRSHQCGVGVGVLLITDEADGLTLDVDFIHQMNKVLFVVAVVLVGLSNLRVEILKNLLHDVVHLTDRDFLKTLLLNDLDHRRHNLMEVSISESNHDTGSGLRNRIDDLLSVKGFQCAVLLNYFHGE